MGMLAFSGEEFGGTSGRAITKVCSHLLLWSLIMIEYLNE
jgi:hypothetical protein